MHVKTHKLFYRSANRYQDVFALLVPSCCENKLLSPCYKVDDGNIFATSCSNKTIISGCYQLVVINFITTVMQTISDLLEQLITSLFASSILLQDNNNLFQSPDLSITGNKQCE